MAQAMVGRRTGLKDNFRTSAHLQAKDDLSGRVERRVFLSQGDAAVGIVMSK